MSRCRSRYYFYYNNNYYNYYYYYYYYYYFIIIFLLKLLWNNIQNNNIAVQVVQAHVKEINKTKSLICAGQNDQNTNMQKKYL